MHVRAIGPWGSVYFTPFFFPRLFKLENFYWCIFKFTDFFFFPMSSPSCNSVQGVSCFMYCIFSSQISIFLNSFCVSTKNSYLLIHFRWIDPFLVPHTSVVIILALKPLSHSTSIWVFQSWQLFYCLFFLWVGYILLVLCMLSNFGLYPGWLCMLCCVDYWLCYNHLENVDVISSQPS